MPPPTRNQVRDSAIRASVLDAFVQLGALDRNNPITQWMFEDDESFANNNMVLNEEDEVVESTIEFAEENRGRTEMKQDLPRSTFKQRFGIRFRSKSRTARKREKRVDTPVDEPAALESKPKTRLGLFSSKSRVVADSAVASVPRSDSTMTPKKSIRRAFGKKQRENVGYEDWEHVAAPLEISKPVVQERNAIELADTIQAETVLSKRFSFAIPRASLKRRRPPSLLIVAETTKGISTSLPPSPFILVAPESDDSSATTPYVLCSPVEQPEIPSGPVYPISVSKTIRRSVIMDNLDVPGPGLRRSISLQELGSTSPSGGLARSMSRRGREVPFPTRPVLPLPLSLAVLGDARNVRMSLDARASVLRQRYQRDTGIRHPPLNPTA
ncbi:hypothetical protein BDP27DRAFT_1343235 [Rhodocollybia butyracea]|uniref:Uncharacterized protein n=1 Tax=Rhodocollybia butyracea TaxID=206335 RepID=A0A9P5P8E1_9AGAR|nr:hypothetical protein BDP27DRAFT_1343235 [Rhodocollybia butyracea]